MRTLLKKTSTGLYFQGPDKWTENPAEALNFKMIDRAVDFVRKWNLTDVELAFAFDKLNHVKPMSLEKVGLGYSE
jgi:hypothetical protein